MNIIKSSLILLLAIVLVSCGAGESSRGTVEPSATSSKSIVSSAHRSKSINQAIEQIRRYPMTKDFAVAVSFPYVITGNLTQAELAHWKGRVQRTQAAIKKMYFKQDPNAVVTVWLFKDESSFYQYNQALWDANPGASFGYYLPKQKRMVMNIASGGGTLTHELVHPYVEANFPQSPLWFNEGLASLYEQAYYKNGKVFGATNWRLRGLQAVIKADSMPSLESMMSTNNTQFMGANRDIYYAQARYLMHYLQSRGLLETYYRQFNLAVASDPTGIKTFLRVASYQSMDQFEPDWINYINSLRF